MTAEAHQFAGSAQCLGRTHPSHPLRILSRQPHRLLNPFISPRRNGGVGHGCALDVLDRLMVVTGRGSVEQPTHGRVVIPSLFTMSTRRGGKAGPKARPPLHMTPAQWRTPDRPSYREPGPRLSPASRRAAGTAAGASRP